MMSNEADKILKELMEQQQQTEQNKRLIVCYKLAEQFEKKHPLKCWKCKIFIPTIEAKRKNCSDCGYNSKNKWEYCAEHSISYWCSEKKCDYDQYLEKKIELLNDKLVELGFSHEGDGFFKYVYEDPRPKCCQIRTIIFGDVETFSTDSFKYSELILNWFPRWKTWNNKQKKTYTISCSVCEQFWKNTANSAEYKQCLSEKKNN